MVVCEAEVMCKSAKRKRHQPYRQRQGPLAQPNQAVKVAGAADKVGWEATKLVDEIVNTSKKE